MVLLRHTLPDASWHFDWLIQRDHPSAPSSSAAGDDARVLRAFRTLIHPAIFALPAPSREPFEAIALPDHRRLYLHYEGPIAHAPRPIATGGAPSPAATAHVCSSGGGGGDGLRGREGGAPCPPLVPDRGSVVRVASGWAHWVLASPDAVTLVGSLGDGAVQTWLGRRIAGDQWRFTPGPATQSGSAEG